MLGEFSSNSLLSLSLSLSLSRLSRDARGSLARVTHVTLVIVLPAIARRLSKSRIITAAWTNFHETTGEEIARRPATARRTERLSHLA